jgi:HSP20 family protein
MLQNTLIPRSLRARSLLDLPMARFPAFWEGMEGEMANLGFEDMGLSVWEDDKQIHVEAALPGLKADQIDVRLEKEILRIEGQMEEKEESKEQKYYSKAKRSYKYRVVLPHHIDEKSEPKTSFKDGILKLSFNKADQTQMKKIAIKNS